MQPSATDARGKRSNVNEPLHFNYCKQHVITDTNPLDVKLLSHDSL